MADNFQERISRLQEADLASPETGVEFVWLVSDFAVYLRSNPALRPPVRRTLERFIRLIDDDATWPLAVQIVGELRKPSTPDPSHAAMSALIAAVQHRFVEVPLDRLNGEAGSWEEQLLARRIVAHVRYVGEVYKLHVTGERPSTEREEALQAVEALLQRLIIE